MKVAPCFGYSMSCGTPVAARCQPTAMRGGAGHSSPPLLSTAGAYARAAGTGGERVGRGHLHSDRLPTEKPLSAAAMPPERFFPMPFASVWRRREHGRPCFYWKGQSVKTRPIRLAAGQNPWHSLWVTLKFTHVHRPPPHLPWRCRAGGAPQTRRQRRGWEQVAALTECRSERGLF